MPLLFLVAASVHDPRPRSKDLVGRSAWLASFYISRVWRFNIICRGYVSCGNGGRGGRLVRIVNCAIPSIVLGKRNIEKIRTIVVGAATVIGDTVAEAARLDPHHLSIDASSKDPVGVCRYVRAVDLNGVLAEHGVFGDVQSTIHDVVLGSEAFAVVVVEVTDFLFIQQYFGVWEQGEV